MQREIFLKTNNSNALHNAYGLSSPYKSTLPTYQTSEQIAVYKNKALDELKAGVFWYLDSDNELLLASSLLVNAENEGKEELADKIYDFFKGKFWE